MQAGPGLQRLNYCLLIVQRHGPSQEWNSSLSEIKGLMLQSWRGKSPAAESTQSRGKTYRVTSSYPVERKLVLKLLGTSTEA